MGSEMCIRDRVYIAGSAPTQLCELHGGHGPASASGSFLSHIFGGGSPKPPQPEPVNANPSAQGDPNNGASTSSDPAKAAEKKKGPLQKIFGIFGDKKKKEPDKPVRDKGDSP